MELRGKIYLAGPEVFFPDAKEIGRQKKLACKLVGCQGLFPLDNEISTQNKTKKQLAQAIAYSNMYMINECDYVIANLSNFRGTEEHPCCDSGTAWECGYALGLGKRVLAYSTTDNSIPEEILSHIDLALKEQLLGLFFEHITFFICPQNNKKQNLKQYLSPKMFNLDNEFSDIQDVNPTTAFILGYRKAKGKVCGAYLSDMRTQIEKYGKFDSKGNSVEDFDLPANLMIAINTDLYPD